MIIKLVILFLGAIVAFWISAICGGGASLILIPVLNLLLPTSFVPFSLTIGTFTSSASRIVVFKKFVKWKIFFWFVPFSIPAVLLGAYLIKYINPVYLQLIISLILISNVPQLFRNKKKQESEEKQSPKYVLAIVGFLVGFISGITGAIGLLFNRFYLKYGLSKEEIVATRAANEIFLHLIKLIIYIILGLYSQTAIWLGIAIALATIASSYTVKYILPYLSEFVFKKIGYSAMVISGIALFYGTSENIIKQDRIAISENRFKETTINWRKNSYVIEFEKGEGLEIECAILSDELPKNLQEKYTALLPQYDKISLEKVYTMGSKLGYEFYCYKEDKLTKFEFDPTAIQ